MNRESNPRRRRVVPALALAGLLVVCRPAGAQEPVPVADPAPADSVAGPGVSAAGAFARSLLLPGWGQAYVGSPGRGAVYFVLEAGSAWMAYKSFRQLEEARDVQEWERESGRLLQTEKLAVVESREEQFEDWVTLSVFVLLFSGIDAYVTAQLADFDEHVGVRPAPGGGISLEGSIPTGRRR